MTKKFIAAVSGLAVGMAAIVYSTPALAAEETAASWGLDRVDQPTRQLDRTYRYNGTGSGVHVFVLDSGIRSSHREFAGRIGAGKDFVIDPGETPEKPRENLEDCNGHGTHVAATIAGSTYGVAKGATIHPVRILGCQNTGDSSLMVQGLNWVRQQTSLRPAVVNISITLPLDRNVDNAINALIADGVTVVAAAGNSSADACRYSPARISSVITVAATGQTDAPSWNSNHGDCVDLFAPGDNITSADIADNTASSRRSGTSMAAPHVAGVVAQYLQYRRSATPYAVADHLAKTAAFGRVLRPAAKTPNLLVQSDGASLRAGFGSLTDVGSLNLTTSALAIPQEPAESLSRSVTSEIAGSTHVEATYAVKHSCVEQLQVELVNPAGDATVVQQGNDKPGMCSAAEAPVSVRVPVKGDSAGSWELRITDKVQDESSSPQRLTGWGLSFSQEK